MASTISVLFWMRLEPVRSFTWIARAGRGRRIVNITRQSVSSDVAARPVEAGDEANPDRVAPGHKDDRHRRGYGLGRERRRGIADDQGYLPVKKVRHQTRQPVSLMLVRAVLDRDVLALDEACFLQTLVERSHAVHRHVSSFARLCRGRRSNELRAKQSRCISSSRHL